MNLLLAAAPPAGLDVWSLVLEAGPMAKLVLAVLAVFSVASWAVMAERFRTFRRAERESDEFMEAFHEAEGLAEVHDTTQALEHSPVATLFRAGFREVSLNPPSPDAGGEEHRAALERVLRKHTSLELTELERSLGFLATTASATPFIGLFGTVWGIMNAFRGIGITGTASLAAYAPGIAEALVATAAGLAAAIPAVIGYNHFIGRLREMEARLEEFAADFLHRVEGRRL